MKDDYYEAVLQHLRLTPAERAVLVEQTEALKVSLDGVLTALKDSTPHDVFDAWAQCSEPTNYVTNLLTMRLRMASDELAKESQ